MENRGAEEDEAASYREMFTQRLRASSVKEDGRNALSRVGLMALYVLMTVQFVGCYLFLSFPYIDIPRFIHGYERLPFQTRLLLAPLFGWAEHSASIVHYASRLARNRYFFPQGIGPAEVLEFYLDIPCLLIAGWVAVQIYRASSRRQLLGWLVYPLFMVLCTVSYLLHTVQNFRFVYDMPSLAFFAVGLYLIYFRKSRLLLVGLFAVATLNRETTLLLIPFYLLSECLQGETARSGPQASSVAAAAGGAARRPALVPSQRVTASRQQFEWRRVLRPEVAITAMLMLVYWGAWHLFIFHMFRHNASEYYPRTVFNLYCFRRLRYYPQLFSACGYLLPFLVIFRKNVRDAQLRLWMWMIPVWYAFMFTWGILVETRVFGEMLPFIACIGTLIAEERVVAALEKRNAADLGDQEDHLHLFRAA